MHKNNTVLDNKGSEKKPSSNPKEIIFSLLSPYDTYHETKNSLNNMREEYTENATIKKISNCGGKHDLYCIIGTLREHYKEHGTLDQLLFVSHGSKGAISIEYIPGSKVNPNSIVKIEDLLEAISELEKELGGQISKRLVFCACSTMRNLNPDEVEYYYNKSKSMNMEIVGALKVGFGGSDPASQFINFSPNKKPTKDRLYEDFSNAYSIDLYDDIYNLLYSSNPKKSEDWVTNYYKNHSNFSDGNNYHKYIYERGNYLSLSNIAEYNNNDEIKSKKYSIKVGEQNYSYQAAYSLKKYEGSDALKFDESNDCVKDFIHEYYGDVIATKNTLKECQEVIDLLNENGVEFCKNIPQSHMFSPDQTIEYFSFVRTYGLGESIEMTKFTSELLDLANVSRRYMIR